MNPEIENLARELCKQAGDEPERRIPEYGRTSWTYPAWEDWRLTAVHILQEREET